MWFWAKKRTGLGPHFLPGLGAESSVLDSAAECIEANSSKVPTAVSTSSRSKSGQVLVRTYVLKYVEFPKALGGMSGVLTLRHTTAMHLLQSGVDITVIALWLGHESLETTHIYIEADLQMKQQALEKVEPAGQSFRRFTPSDDLLAFLSAL